MLAATKTRPGNRVPASVVAPILSSKDDRREPEVAEDEVKRHQMAAIFGEEWRNRSDEIDNHCDDSLEDTC